MPPAANESGKAGIRVNVICPAAAMESYLWWRENYPDIQRRRKIWSRPAISAIRRTILPGRHFHFRRE